MNCDDGDRQVIDRTACAVCGAVITTILHGDHLDYELEPHDIALHQRIIQRAVAARWN